MTFTNASAAVRTGTGDGEKPRVRFRNTSASDGLLHAGWWPRSRDLVRELPALLEVVRGSGLDVVQVSYALNFWDPVPRRPNIGGRIVQMSGFHTQLPFLLTLIGRSGRGRIDVLVVPPETEPAVAKRALTIVATTASQDHPSQVLDRAHTETAAASAD